MLKSVRYKKNTFIIVQSNKDASAFYIIRSGSVRVTSNIPILSTDNDDQVLGQGDFFGVVEALSGHPYMEQALCLDNAELIVVESTNLLSLIQRNVAIAIKMIRFFSLRLRMIDEAMTKFRDSAPQDGSPENMYHIAMFYYQKKEVTFASYAFKKYLYYFPTGTYANASKKHLEDLIEYPDEKESQVEGSKSDIQLGNLTKEFPDGAIVFIESEPGSEVYIIQKGYIKISKQVDNTEVLLAILKPGDIFGEMALLENKPRSASASAHGDVSLLAINKANFELIVQKQPAVTNKLLVLLSERIWGAFQQLANLIISDPIGSLYDMLWILFLRKKLSKLNHNKSFQFDVSGEELSKMVGFSGEDSKKYILEFLKDKTLSMNMGKIFCHDLDELEKQATFYRKRAIQEMTSKLLLKET